MAPLEKFLQKSSVQIIDMYFWKLTSFQKQYIAKQLMYITAVFELVCHLKLHAKLIPLCFVAVTNVCAGPLMTYANRILLKNTD